MSKLVELINDSILAKKNVVNLFDIGAADGQPSQWNLIKNKVIVGFEPESIAFNRLIEDSPTGYIFFNSAVGKCSEIRKLNLTKKRQCSSFLPPNTEFLSHFKNPDRFIVEETIDLNIESLDTICTANNIFPDFLKIDTQGFELEILKGCEEFCFENLLGLDIEVCFQEIYLGQPLFSDIDRFLRSKGFYLADIELIRHNRNFDEYQLTDSSELFFGNAFYLKDVKSENWNESLIIKAAILSAAYGYEGYSLDLLRSKMKEFSIEFHQFIEELLGKLKANDPSFLRKLEKEISWQTKKIFKRY
tara:strand:+ start:720 stop:1628 length:909 start_codon:yes stop_codon:yes gene_type:complete